MTLCQRAGTTATRVLSGVVGLGYVGELAEVGSLVLIEGYQIPDLVELRSRPVCRRAHLNPLITPLVLSHAISLITRPTPHHVAD